MRNQREQRIQSLLHVLVPVASIREKVDFSNHIFPNQKVSLTFLCSTPNSFVTCVGEGTGRLKYFY